MDKSRIKYKCEYCGRHFIWKSYLEAHVRIHTGEKPYKCETCDAAFAQKGVLSRHVRMHTGEQPCKCEVCGEAFRLKFSLISHMRKHRGKKLYTCKTCGKQFIDKRALSKHSMRHTGKKAYTCKSWGKQIINKRASTNHCMIHNGEKHFKCDICRKCFSVKINLNSHMKKHTKDKRYTCKVCGKGFFQKYVLTRHSKIHRSIRGKPFVCEVYGKAFCESGQLCKHNRLHDTTEELHNCDAGLQISDTMSISDERLCIEEFNQPLSQATHGATGTTGADRSMGSTLSKMKPAKSLETSLQQTGPEPLNGRLPQFVGGSTTNNSRRNSDDFLLQKHGSSKQNTRKRKRRISEVEPDSESDDEVTFNIKRKKRTHDVSLKQSGSEQVMCKDISVESLSPSAKSTAHSSKSATSANKHLNKSDKEMADTQFVYTAEHSKNIDSVQNQKGLSLSEIYTNVLKDQISDTSPFKGKMSAFEISLLKGKQSMERRKSLEAAALRSSPRMNSNVQKPDYADNKRRRTNSLPQTGGEKNRTRKRQTGQCKSLRIRTNKGRQDGKSLSAVSPSSIENRFVEQNSPARKRRRATLNSNISEESKADSPKSRDGRQSADRSRGRKSAGDTAFAYRMNGSPKLRPVPPVLSLTSLSGMEQNLQGSSLSSLHTELRSNGLSGTPAALSDPPSALQSGSPSSRARSSSSSARPDSLPVADSSAIPDSADQQHTPGSSSKADIDSSHIAHVTPTKQSEVSRARNKRMTLEETVNMLRKSASGTCTGRRRRSDASRSCSSPATSEGRMSRRSSRSSTPNISPLKPEMLTPSNTPTSSPGKSPRSSPSGQLQSKKRRYLFAKNDDVLARWHDGLQYSGTILRIDEKNSKCLLRYEDNSEFWSLFKDIHRVAREEEMICCVCFGELSEPPDEIVLCDNCSQGYHQKCHLPNIDSRQIVDPDDEWFCRECVFLMAAKVGGAIKDGKTGDELKKMKTCLPYEVEQLTWDTQHKNNVEQCYCYCGGPGIWYQKMLQCCRCKQWYHEACMQCTEFPLMFGDSFYIFVCTNCNMGSEYIKRVDVEWQDLLHIALFNLIMENKKRKYYHIRKDILPWLDTYHTSLQIPQYEDLGVEEKFTLTMDALQNNKTRFSCGGDLCKKLSLWGLRIRVPPPRIFITLPVTCKVTDEVMKKLKIKGRRSKVFIPMECKSPVLQIRHSPLHPNTSVRKRLDTALSMKVEGSNSPARPQVTTPTSAASSRPRKPRIKLPLLDRLIPHTPFSTTLHPFKTEVELREARLELNKRADILAGYQNPTSGSIDTVEAEDLILEGPPILEKVEPISPSNSNSSTPPMPEIQNKKRSRKSVQSDIKDQSEAQGAESRRKSRRVSLKANAPPNILPDTQVCVKKVKSSGENYFCAFDKTGYGKGFYVMGTRVSESGLQYLVNWEL